MPQFYCDDPAVPAWRANLTPTTYCCVECDAEFLSCQAQAFYCSPRCQGAAVSRKLKARAEPARAAKERICVRCEKPFRPSRPNQAQKARGYVQQCCSVECRRALVKIYPTKKEANRARYARRAERARADRPPHPILSCEACSKRLPMNKRRFCTDACRARARYVSKPPIEMTCVICCTRYMKGGKGSGTKRTCSDACSAILERAQRQAMKVRQRVRGRPIETEVIIDTHVFEAANWRCAICSTVTPPAHRGTLKPDAPEIDHVIPLSAGGDHVRANVQLLCHLCNAAKGDHPFPHVTFWPRRGIAPPI